MKLITLDWEGTLVDFQWNLEEAVDETTRMLLAKNIPQEVLIGLDYAAIYNLVREMSPRWGFRNGSLLALVDEIYDRYDLEAASRWVPAPDLDQTLAALKDFELALVSNIGRSCVKKMLDRLDLHDRFGMVITRNDVSFLKPSPEGIIKAMSWAGVDKNETIHIGDSLSDLYAARNAGVKSGILLGGQSKPEELLPEKPDLVLDKLSDLPAALTVL